MGIKNVRQVNREIAGWERDLPDLLKLYRDKTVYLILGAGVEVGGRVVVTSGVLTSTPVDTGFARWQWSISEGSPVFMDQGQKSGLSRNSPPTFDELSKLSPAIEEAGPYTIVWLTNSAAYITRLNEGHSSQAAPHWIELAVADALRVVDGITITV